DDIAIISSDIKALKSSSNPPWVVLLAKTIQLEQFAACVACGIDGYLLEDISPEALLDSLHLVTHGEKVYPSQLATYLCAEHLSPPRRDVKELGHIIPLSDRELHIVQWLADGCPNKVIATKLDITEATVKVHVKAILKKLGVQNRTQAAIWAIQHGITFSPELVVPLSSMPPRLHL
ncbi:MAG TPA: response regulator transcription factor, partial [Pseudorhizobium sp.]|nr:response regulator transcription factor [Pseudorhizobium sp.]